MRARRGDIEEGRERGGARAINWDECEDGLNGEREEDRGGERAMHREAKRVRLMI